MARKKRAWNNTNPLYRYLQSKKSRSTRRQSTTGTKTTMARRRKSGRRYGSRRAGSSSLTPMNALIAGAIYGLAEQPAMNVIAPLASKLPFGQYNVPLAKAGASYLIATKMSGLAKNVGLAGLNVVGKELSAGVMGAQTASSSSGTTFY